MHNQVIEYVMAAAVVVAACGVGGVGFVGLIVWLCSKVWKTPRQAK